MIEFKLRGAAEINRLLKDLGPRLAGKVADKALRAGAKPIVAEAKRLAPKKTGQLAKAIAVAKARDRGGDTRTLHIGFKPPVSRRAHLVEFGTSKMSAKPFVRPAMDAKASEALAEMTKEMARGLAREAESLARRK